MCSRAVFRLIVSSAATHVRRMTFFATQRLAQRMVALVWNGTRKTSVGCLPRLEAWPGFVSLSIFWQVARCLLVHFSISSREIVDGVSNKLCAILTSGQLSERFCTSAMQGIVARRLADQGARILIHGRDRHRGKQVVDQIQRAADRALVGGASRRRAHSSWYSFQ